MGRSVGIDLVSVDEIRAAVRDHGERYLDAVFSPAERARCGASARRLAECFAAKEAAIKALGAAERPPWHAIELLADDRGCLLLRLSGCAAERGVERMTVSVARAGADVIAVVLAADAPQ